MGEAISRDLVSKGWLVAMCDINAKESLQKEFGDKASFHKTNVADYDSQAQAFQEVWNKYGRIDALCANAGIVDKECVLLNAPGQVSDNLIAPSTS